MTPKAQATILKKIDKLDFIIIKNFHASKYTIKDSEKTIQKMEEHICKTPENGLISRIHKEHL